MMRASFWESRTFTAAYFDLKVRLPSSGRMRVPATAVCIQSPHHRVWFRVARKVVSLGILPGIVGVMQATEAIKLILGIGDTLIGRLILFNALSMKFRELKLRKDPKCPICGESPTINQLIDYEQFCGIGTEADEVVLEADSVITARRLNERLNRGDEISILDVREPHEFEICRILGSTLIPLGELQSRVGELDRDSEIVAHCRSGVRSAKAVKLLREAGFTKVRNLTGGVLAWSNEVDPTMPKY